MGEIPPREIDALQTGLDGLGITQNWSRSWSLQLGKGTSFKVFCRRS